MKNGDLVFFFIVAIMVVAMWAMMKRYPANIGVRNTQSPLPSGLYTSGNLNNGMDVQNRTNFQMQPNGGNNGA